MSVAALFVRSDSVYRRIAGVECFDAGRDARTFALDRPVIAHPPCRAWCNFAQWAKPRPDERDLAHWAVHVVRHCGGVLEHPVTSKLWQEIGALTPGVRDQHGGVLVTILQRWFGHPAIKATGLYVVGPVPDIEGHVNDLPARTTVERQSRADRERTPPRLAHFLVRTARGCS